MKYHMTVYAELSNKLHLKKKVSFMNERVNKAHANTGCININDKC